LQRNGQHKYLAKFKIVAGHVYFDFREKELFKGMGVDIALAVVELDGTSDE